MEPDQNSTLKAKSTEAKCFSADLLLPNSYCDILDDYTWKVGFITERTGEVISVKLDGYQNKIDEKVSIKKANRVNYFRRFTQGYTGNPKLAVKNLTSTVEEIKGYQAMIKKLINSKFLLQSPHEITQVLRGQVFTGIDSMMMSSYPTKDYQACIPLVMETIVDCMNMIVEYFKFYQANADTASVLFKNKDLFLVDHKCAVIAALPEIIETLRRIFGNDGRVSEFYKIYEDTIKKYYKPFTTRDFKTKICIDKAYNKGVTIEYSSVKISAGLIAYVIDSFYEKGGFDLILSIVSNTPSLPFEIIELFLIPLGLIGPITDNLQIGFTSQLKSLKDAITNRIYNLTEAEIKEVKKQTIVHCLSSITGLLQFDNKQRQIIFEELYMTYFFKCLTSKTLEKRIAAMNSFNLIIDTLDYTESRPTSLVYGIHRVEIDENIEQLDSQTFVQFLKEIGIIDVILGENIHEEILKRAVPIFKLFAKKNWGVVNMNMNININLSMTSSQVKASSTTTEVQTFSVQVYDCLWKNFLEKHESVSIQIENIICELAQYISEKDKVYLYAKIKAYSFTTLINDSSSSLISNFHVAGRVISFIKHFTENCFRRSAIVFPTNVEILTEPRLFGLPLLWHFMQDSFLLNDQGVRIQQGSAEIIQACVDSIKRLLDIASLDCVIREKILFLCFNNFRLNLSVVQSISLSTKIMMTDYFRGPNGKKVLKKMDDHLVGILECLIYDLGRYLTKVASIVLNYPKDTHLNILTVTFEGFYSHEINLKSRLNFIYFLTGNASKDRKLLLSADQLIRLWDMLSLNANSAYESDLFYDSLNSNIEEWDSSMIEYMYKNILINKDKFCIQTMNRKSLSLFKAIFLTMNQKYKKIVNDIKTFRVQADDILGVDTLWSMLLESLDDGIRNEVACILGNICLSLKVYTEEFSVKYWKKFMEKLLSAFNTCYVNKLENGVKGVITLIKFILSNLGNSGIIPQYEDCNWPPSGCDYYMFSIPDRDQKYQIKVALNDPCYEVRWRAAYFFDIPVNRVKMKYGKKIIDLNNDFELFRTYFHLGTIIEIKEGSHPIFALKTNPKTILYSEVKLVEILFELLHCSDKTFIQDCWELINMLPKNLELEEAIGALGQTVNTSVDWNKFFDDKSIYVMSYTLKIIKSFVFSIKCDTAKSTVSGTSGGLSTQKRISICNADWISNFIKNKGAMAIINLIFQMKVEHFTMKSNLGFECLNDLLSIIKTILIHGNSSTNNLLSSDTLLSLNNQIIELIRLIVEASFEKDSDVNLIEIQAKYQKKRERETNAMEVSLNESDEGNRDRGVGLDLSEYCEEYNKIWNEENKSIDNLLSFPEILKSKDMFLNLLLTEYKKEMEYIFTIGIICSKNDKFKYTLQNFIHGFLSSTDIDETLRLGFKSSLFEILLNGKTLEMANCHRETSGYFFKMLAFLLDQHFDISRNDINVDFILLSEYIAKYVHSLEDDTTTNTTVSLSSFDHVLEGYLRVLRVLVLKSPEISENLISKFNLFDTVLMKCIFSKCTSPPLAQPYPKCKTPSSRQSAFQFMSALAYNNPAIMLKILAILNDYHMLGFWKSKKLIDWKISLAFDKKSTTGYVGLKNLGCTCYMNSLLQQFFMIPRLRETLLAAQDISTSKLEESSLFQLKNIFSSLKAYESQSYNPKDFCQNFDGQVLDIKEQMDVDEFYNSLIDKIENHLKGSAYQSSFRHFFGGKLSDELIFKGCPHTRENHVFFNSIQLQVMNKKSIIESLKSFVAGEMMEGDNAIHCEKCEKKFPALKRQSFKHLPRMLIIVMKRFEFDYDRMIKIKVNDYCEFPMELDMEPYTHEYIRKCERDKANEEEGGNEEASEDKKEFLYGLSGVLIHSGTSEGGHYYSIIKDSEKDAWYTFNDTNVTQYDISDLRHEAFGGTEIVMTRDNKKETVEKWTNAYVLFYTKLYDNTEDTCNAVDASSINDTNSNQSFIPCPIVKIWDRFSNIPTVIMEKINQDMLHYWVTKVLFSKEYHLFIIDLLVNFNSFDNIVLNYQTKNENENYDPIMDLRSSKVKASPVKASMTSMTVTTNVTSSNIENDMIYKFDTKSQNEFFIDPKNDIPLFKFASSFFFNVLIRARDKYYLPHIVDILKAFINKHHLNAEWLLEEFANFDMIIEYLIEAPAREMKKLIVGILYASMIKIFKVEKYEIVNKSLKMFIGNMMAFIMKYKDAKDVTYPCYILYRFTCLGENSCVYLIVNGLFGYLTFFYLHRYDRSKAVYDMMVERIVQLKNEVTKAPHCELCQKPAKKFDKLSSSEESIEKSHYERLLNEKNENYLLMAYYNMAITCHANLETPLMQKDKALFKYFSMDSTEFIKVLLSEINTKSAAVAFSKMMAHVCQNNINNTEAYQSVLLESIRDADSDGLEYLFIAFKRFLIRIEDNLRETRIKTTMIKYFQILAENQRFYAYMEANIDFTINLFQKNCDVFKSYVDTLKDGISKLSKFLKDNPIPPKMTPIKGLVMYKKVIYTHPIKPSPFAVKRFEDTCIASSKEKREKLNDILKSNIYQAILYYITYRSYLEKKWV